MRPPGLYLSPHYREGSFNYTYTLDDKITIFEDQINGWCLDVADLMLNGKKDEKGDYLIQPIPWSDQAALGVIFSYFEMVGHYKLGIGTEKKEEAGNAFKAGFKDIFNIKETDPYFEEIYNIFYKKGRNGLYHSLQLGDSFILAIDPDAIFRYGNFDVFDFFLKNKALRVNVQNLVNHLKTHFTKMIALLKNPSNTSNRQNFEYWYDLKNPITLNRTPPPEWIELKTETIIIDPAS